MKTRFTFNYQTTLAGLLAGLPQLIQGSIDKNPEHIITGAATILLGFLSRDAFQKKSNN